MSGGDEYRDASRRPFVSLPGGSRRFESSVKSSSSSEESTNVRARIKCGSAMTTMTTTRLRTVNTCEEETSSSADERTTASSPPRNGLTLRGAEEAGRINGYTLKSNGHVHVSSRRYGQPPLVLAIRFDLVSPDPIYTSVCV